jgi:hypothetical protein
MRCLSDVLPREGVQEIAGRQNIYILEGRGFLGPLGAQEIDERQNIYILEGRWLFMRKPYRFPREKLKSFFTEKRKTYILNHIVELLQTKPNQTNKRK